MADRRRDIWMYSILYHMCRILGVLPVSRNLHLNLALHPCGPEQDCFSPSPNGMVVNLLHIVFCSVSAYVLRHPLPTDKSATALFSLWAVNWASAIVALLVSLFYTKEIAECLSSTCRNVTFSSTHLYRLPFLLFILLLLFPLFPVLHTCPCLVFYKWVLFNYAYAPVAAVEVIISMVTFLTERTYNDINRQLRVYKENDVSVKMFPSLLYHLDCHISVGKSVRRFSNTFSLHFLNIFLSFTLRCICYAVLLVSFGRDKKFGDLKTTSFQCFYLIFRLFFVCYRCHKAREEATDTCTIVRRLRVQWLGEMSEHQSELLSTYEDLLEATAVEFSACGFFPVSMLQALNVLGVITTYGLIALQTR